MVFKTTKKAIRENFSKIIGIGYCNAQYLLQFNDRFAYSAGANGWACDYHKIGNVCISTGYNYISTIKPTYELIDKYNKEAEKIALDYSIEWQERREQVNKLLEEFVNECIK